MINIIKYPTRAHWELLAKRPETIDEDIDQTIRSIFEQVKFRGDLAVKEFTRLFDGATLEDFAVPEKEIAKAEASISNDLKTAIKQAYQNIRCFHETSVFNEQKVETMPGIYCWRKRSPIQRVGLYIPGGSAPLFSSLLMLGIPAKLAGCEDIVICTPPNAEGNIHPSILYVASFLGLNKIYRVGGVQAIAAMALGTRTIGKVDKIFGPGNSFVTKAKEYAQQFGVAIDMPAGPSEVLVIADSSANPEYVAADLLSQAEHGPDSQVILLSDSETVLNQCVAEVNLQLESLPRRDIAKKALDNSKAILLNDSAECLEFSNIYAPEHLIIATDDANQLAEGVMNAGSVFIGNFSCESAGDYASGTNHTLPTNGFAKNYSGVSVESFTKKITFQNITAEGIQNLGPTIETMAEAEGLWGHKNAVSLRLKDLKNV